MAAGQQGALASSLLAGGLPSDTPVVIVENASLPEMTRTATTLGALQRAAERTAHGPALILVGRVFRRAVFRLHDDARDRAAARQAATTLLCA
jgi:uroporphyrin-III C-methyltransferase